MSPPLNPPSVIVIGSGITGLSVAWALLEAGVRELTVLEASSRSGGAVRSEAWQGFLFEFGPDSFLRPKPAALELCRELGLEAELISTLPAPAGARLLYQGRVEPLPAGWRMIEPGELAPCLASPLFTEKEKLDLATHWPAAALAEPPSPAIDAADPGGSPDFSIAEYLRARYGALAGEAIARRIAGPMLAGVYGGSVEKLSYRSARSNRAPAPRGSGSLFVSLRRGMQTLVDALESALASHLPPMRLRRNARAAAILHREGDDGDARYQVHLADGSSLSAGAVVAATPASVTARLVREIDRDLSAALAAIPYASSVNLNLAYREAPRLPEGHGFLAASETGRRLLACTFAHQKFPGRAPGGGALLRVFYGEAECGLSDPGLESLAQTELRAALGISVVPARIGIQRCPSAIPQYTVGHAERLAAIQAALPRHPGLYLAGSAYGGVGLPDCIAGATAVARAICSTPPGAAE